MVFLTDADESESRALPGRLDRLVNEHNAREQRGYDLRYSVGLVGYDPERHASVADMLQDCDKLMYEDKQGKGGRLPRCVQEFRTTFPGAYASDFDVIPFSVGPPVAGVPHG